MTNCRLPLRTVHDKWKHADGYRAKTRCYVNILGFEIRKNLVQKNIFDFLIVAREKSKNQKNDKKCKKMTKMTKNDKNDKK